MDWGMRDKRVKLRYWFYFIAVAALTSLYFLEPVAAPYPFDGQQIWKHRQNSPEQAIEAVSEGFSGVEIDITYLNGRLYVAHDASEYDRAILLEDYVKVLDHAGNSDLKIWLDIKNINLWNEAHVKEQILSLDMAGRLLVESPSPMSMFRLCRDGITCSVWAKNSHSFPLNVWYRFWINMLSRISSVASTSIDYRVWKPNGRVVPSSFPKQLYTFPPNSTFEKYKSHPEIRILLAD